MVAGPELHTSRLLLRRWRDADRAPFAAMNADRVVMEHFPSTLTGVESDDLVDRFEQHFEERGYGLWAVEVLGGEPFIGFVGLNSWDSDFDAPFTPAVEVGWRFAADHWGRGFATEGAAAAVAFAFGELRLDDIVSFTVVANQPSRRVMERLGMTHDPADDFDHPRLPEGHPMRRHMLYRLRAVDWAGQTPDPDSTKPA